LTFSLIPEIKLECLGMTLNSPNDYLMAVESYTILLILIEKSKLYLFRGRQSDELVLCWI